MHKKPSNQVLTTRIQKGGALLGEMRQLVGAWRDDVESDSAAAFIMSILGTPSLARARDTYVRVFRPRFIDGNPPNAWRLARILEDSDADPETIRIFYYWLTARAEPVLYRFVVEKLSEIRFSGSDQIKVDETAHWLKSVLNSQGHEWSPTVTLKVARGLLAALRDFGMLQGRSIKKITSFHCPLEAFALIAFCLYDMGISGRTMVVHPDWRLFLFNTEDVEQFLLTCHQRGWLNYQAAGDIHRIEFPVNTFKEYVCVVLDR